MPAPVDPTNVLMTGENSFIRLSPDGGKTQSDRLSHWRVLWCPAGSGHALFIQSALTEGKARVYADNAAVARWLQRTIETLLFPAFADPDLPVLGAEFARSGSPHSAVRPGTFNGGMVVGAWYDVYGVEGVRREDGAGVRASQARVEALIAREQGRGISAARLALAGFSQGGAIALHTGLRHADRLA